MCILPQSWKTFVAPALLAVVCLAGGEPLPAAPFPESVKGFLKSHCYECHNASTQSGGLNLLELSSELATADQIERWTLIHDRIAADEMPPADAQQPPIRERNAAVKSLRERLIPADRAHREVVLRRLNRAEYENTVGDLFGIHVDLNRLLLQDAADNRFDTIGESLSISAEQMAMYVEAADRVLDQVFGPAREPKRIHKRVNAKDLRAVISSDRKLSNGIVLFNARALPMYGVSVADPGTYRLRIETRAMQSKSPLVMRVDGGVTGRVASHVAGFFEVRPEKVMTVEVIDRAVEKYDTFAISLERGYPSWKLDAEKYEGPGLFLGSIELDGPLEAWPPASRRKLLGNIDPAKGTLADVRSILKKLLPRAFRRSPRDTDPELYVQLAQEALDEGAPFEKALRRALKGVLCAPEFLFLEESSVENGRLDDYAVAARLSYFLWKSMPDEELRALAGQGNLQKPDVLQAQVERMLCDPKSQRFVENFTSQWLKLRDIDFTVPDRRLYPEYDRLLRRAMLDETHSFFREILDEDLSVQNFIDSDFAILNQPLAEFYGIDGVEGLAMRRVGLPADSVRGGVMTQAAVLKVSADGTSTSPVLRGSWILKNLFGEPPPPPPAGVEAIEPDIRGATTVREQLARHRQDASCNRCHQKIDPFGFALESFDVIGGWRTWYRTANEGKPVKRLLHPHTSRNVRYRRGPEVDCSGELADGRTFADIREFKQLLLADPTAMTRSLTRILLTYSLGRRLGFADRPEIDRIVEIVHTKHHNGLRSLIHEVVQSKLFRTP